MAGLLVLGLAACSPTLQTPEARARDIAEQWIAAARDGNEDAGAALVCAGVDPRTGVNSDTAGFKSYTLELEDRGEGVFFARFTTSDPGNDGLGGILTISTDGRACIEASE